MSGCAAFIFDFPFENIESAYIVFDTPQFAPDGRTIESTETPKTSDLKVQNPGLINNWVPPLLPLELFYISRFKTLNIEEGFGNLADQII